MSNADKILTKAKKLHKEGKFQDAILNYKKLLKTTKVNSQIYYLIGTAFLQLRNYFETVNYIKKAVEIEKFKPSYYNNLGIALSQLNDNKNAIENYKKAIKLDSNFLDANINLGIAYMKEIKFEDAMKHFAISLKIAPNNYKIYNNIGNLLRNMGKTEEAIKSYDKSIEYNKENVEAYNNKAEIFLSKKKFSLAIKMFDEALKIDPEFNYMFGKYFHTKMHICDWDNFHKDLRKIESEIKNNKKIIEPFPLLSLLDDMNIQKKNAILFNNEAFQNIGNFRIKVNKKKNKKIKVGYFAAEFYNHPVLQLTKDIFKNHDNSKFEIYGFFHGKVKDDLHFEVKKYFDDFFDINNKSDEEIVSLSNKIGIDIAINLTGYTSDSRNEIYLKRVAPIQISYLGYSGTMGTSFIDYIIGDNVLIPKNFEKYYSEKIIHLPISFFPNPANIVISNKKFSKVSVGIPEKKFVFGSFNNSYKITPIIFDTWMEILKRSKNSILWLLKNNEIASKNLLKEAEKRNVDPSRIIFADKLIYSEHLSRFELMDLFLDTFPYNGHTTVIEAIRRKVPTLTIMGQSFASRVAGSILNSLDLNELISNNLEEYIKIAVDVSEDVNKFNNIKKKIDLEKTKILFDSNRYTKNLENLYINLYQKHF